AILGLTGMNVYSLYALRNQSIDSQKENKKLQVAEFADKARNRFITPFAGLLSKDIEKLEETFRQTGQFTPEVFKILNNAAADSIYEGIYFIPANTTNCQNIDLFLKYDAAGNRFVRTNGDNEIICDGMGMARTRMRVLMEEYNYNNKIIFDTHRSMTIALVNLNDDSVFGYLTMPTNMEYLRNHYLQPTLEQKFGSEQNSGIKVWLRDWTKEKTIASSDTSVEYDRQKVQFNQKFPDLFDDWYLAVAFTTDPMIAASNKTLYKNLIVLGAAFFLLLGALIFMFITAQRERELAERQAGFLANVTHELKTPLAVMQAAGENLADGRVDNKERLKAYGNHIHSESIRLRKMIEKLLDVAKADTNQSLIEPKPVHLNRLLQKYIDEHADYVQEKGFTLETSINDDLDRVMIDTDSFDTIIGNLLENAIKYSRDEKYIGISLEQKDSEIILKVKDHGMGIPKKSMKHIFEKFYRAEDVLTANTKGHGLGLSIVKNLVEQNGGEVTVRSEENSGSCFTIRFPVAQEEDIQQYHLSNPVEPDKQTQESSEYVG
ncbi:MAG: sensor histidine kinase, partial [Candidatus Halalkalibacterium sp. M3_1C_030]